MEIIEGLKFSCFTDNSLYISGVFLEAFDVFIRVVHTKTLFNVTFYADFC